MLYFVMDNGLIQKITVKMCAEIARHKFTKKRNKKPSDEGIMKALTNSQQANVQQKLRRIKSRILNRYPTNSLFFRHPRAR